MNFVNRLLSRRSILKANKRKALACTRLPIAADIHPRHAAKDPKQFAEVVLLGVFRDVGHAQGGEVVPA